MNLFNELKRRNVFRVGIAYTIVAWLIAQVLELVLDSFGAPDWVMKTILVVLAAGLPLALVFAWAFELTPEGVKRERDVDRSQSIAPQTGKKLNTAILVLMSLAIAYLLYDKFSVTPPVSPSASATEVAQRVAQPEPEPHTTTRADRQSIAVLPFANRSNREDDLFFTDGIHDDLLTQLAKIEGLKVISRTSVMEYRGTTKKIPDIAAELGVGNILEGGIQRAGNRVRINAQLIDVEHDEHLWAETYDREMTIENLFDIQSDITLAIISAVKLELSDDQQQSLGSLPTNNLEAYEAFLRARAAINRADYTVGKFLDALPWAEKAVELDPSFAEGWGIVTEIYGQLHWIGLGSPGEHEAKAAEALDRTHETGPGTAAAHAAQALWYYRFDRDFKKALEQYDLALAQQPGNDAWMVYKALSERRLGLWDEAIQTFERILVLDPVNVWAMTQMANTLGYMHEWEALSRRLDDWILRFPDSADLRSERIMAYLRLVQLDQAMTMIESELKGDGPFSDEAMNVLLARREFQRIVNLLEVNPMPDPLENAIFLGRASSYLGQVEAAQSHFRDALEIISSQEPPSSRMEGFRLASEAQVLASLGEHERALAAIQKAVNLTPFELDQLDGSIIQMMRIRVLAAAGQLDEALELITETVDSPGGLSRGELRIDPFWDFARDDERFQALVTSGNAN